MADRIREAARRQSLRPIGIEGDSENDWIWGRVTPGHDLKPIPKPVGNEEYSGGGKINVPKPSGTYDILDIITTVKVVPSPLVMSSIPASRGAEGEVLVYSYRTDDLEFVEIKVDPKLTGLIETIVESISKEDLAKHELALSGKKLKIRLKSGLPLGALDQTVWVTTNLQDSPLVPVYFQGTVVSDIAIYGKRFDRTTNLLNIGRVSRKDGFRTELRILVRGEHRQTTKFQVAAVDPKGILEVKIRPSGDVGSGKTVQHILEVAVPKEAPLISRLGTGQGKSGQIVLSTTHSELKKIVITVEFEVSD